jgi:hypothetical protein
MPFAFGRRMNVYAMRDNSIDRSAAVLAKPLVLRPNRPLSRS